MKAQIEQIKKKRDRLLHKLSLLSDKATDINIQLEKIKAVLELLDDSTKSKEDK